MNLTRSTIVFLLTASCCFAAAEIKVTEMWVGGLPGTEATSDWFELTNFGDMPLSGIDGNIYYDDNSADPTVDDQMFGIDSIAPGESVIYLTSWEDDWATAADAIAAFDAMWGAPAGSLNGIQIGYVDGGSGLGGGGDAVFVFDSNQANANIIASQQYQGNADNNFASFASDAAGNDSFFPDEPRAVVGVLGAYEGNLAASDGMYSTGAPVPNAVGSPGVVPEPAACSLMLLSLAGLLATCRR